MLSEAVKNEIKGLLKNYKTPRSALLPALDLAQRDRGNLVEEDMREVAEILEIEPVIANEITGFYTMYNVERAMGRHHVQVCRNLPCSLMGAEHIIEYLEKTLDCKTGDTSHNKKYTLNTVECLGSCGTAPMMQINDEYYENLDETKIDEILKGLK
ncbi:MAG: NAD(P)H-dependent oxidoreductase subunit E [Thermodesulfobacteriota bacterium]